MTNIFIRDKLKRPSVASGPSELACAFFGLESGGDDIKIQNGELIFKDLSGAIRIIPLNECNKSSIASATRIGERGLLSSPPWVILFDERLSRLEFANKLIAYELLISPLAKLGFATLDRD
ncbi:MAG: hypothetical protein U1F46_11315 [Marinagarivorans sp.]